MLDQAALNAFFNAAQEMQTTALDQRQPHVLMHPAIYPDGNQWCALYGEDIQSGVAGFGDTPAAAAADFDRNWIGQRLNVATSAASAAEGSGKGGA